MTRIARLGLVLIALTIGALGCGSNKHSAGGSQSNTTVSTQGMTVGQFAQLNDSQQRTAAESILQQLVYPNTVANQDYVIRQLRSAKERNFDSHTVLSWMGEAFHSCSAYGQPCP